MTTDTKPPIIEEALKQLEDCSSPYFCNHETTEKHYVIWKDELEKLLIQAYHQGEEAERERILNLPKLQLEKYETTDFPIRDKETRNQIRRMITNEIIK